MIKKIYFKLKREGIWNFTRLAIARSLANLIAFPIALIIFALSPFIKIRFIRLFSTRIGHYALNTELFLCAKDINLYNEGKKITLFYTQPGQRICNAQLHKMWKRVIFIIPFSLITNQIDKFLMIFLGDNYSKDSYKQIFESSTGGHDRWGFIYNTKKGHLLFTAEEKHKGEVLMEKLGIPKDALFVCLIGRDSNYLKTHLPNTDWTYHNYRDVDINSYIKAAEFLAMNGYYVVRIGRYVNAKLNVKNPKIIDYANSELCSDFLDIYLSSKCYFMISTGCGLDSVSHVFRRPVLITNVPLCDVRSYYFYWQLFIPKKLIDLTTGSLVSFKKMYETFPNTLHRNEINNVLKQKNWEFVDNSPDEIVDAVKEMLEQLKGSVDFQYDSKLHEKFWLDFISREVLEPILEFNLVSFETKKIHVGNSFLKQYSTLLN